MSPKSVDKEAKKEGIIKAATSVFAKNGFGNTRMADIAEAAGIGKGTIYEYFRSKDEIFRETFSYFTDSTNAEIAKKLLFVTDPKEKLVIFVQSTLEAFINNKDVVDVFFDFWAEGIRARDEKIDLHELYDQYGKYIVSFLSEGVKAGVFRPMKTMMVAMIIIGALDGLFVHWLLDKENFPLIEAGRELTDTILKGIET